MVTGPPEHGIQADVVFVIESTASNGAYINEFRTNYIIPTLEYFSQGGIEEHEYAAETSQTQYGIVTYHAADCLPSPFTGVYGPFANPHKVLTTLEKLELIGGKGESHANIGEGLATALQCFEDLQVRREPNVASQKHCILVCNSPPYQVGVQESYAFSGYTVEQLAGLFQERNISLSILSPRKIPSIFKLFEKAGGDLQSSQTKNYAKDPRHLVLLRNYNLKESPVSPTTAPIAAAGPAGAGATGVQSQTPSAAQIALSPLQTSPNYAHPAPRAPHVRANWMRPPFMGPGGPGPAGPTPTVPQPPTNTQSSALIAQLSQPPQPPSAMGLNVQPFAGTPNTGMGVNNPNQNQQQQQQLNQQLNQQQQLRINMQVQQQLQQQNAAQQQNPQLPMGMQAQPTPPQTGPQLNVSGVNHAMQQVSQNVSVSQAPSMQAAPVPAQMSQQGNNAPGPVMQPVNQERTTIWKGMLEWVEKSKTTNDAHKQTWQVPCQVSVASKDGEPEVKAESWPSKLIMQLMPKTLIGNIGQAYLKNSKSVIFHPSPCEALEALIKVMSNGFAGCVHFTSTSTCNIKVLLLLYTSEKRTFLGFIPNDQQAFVDRLRKVIQQQKSSHAMLRQGQVPLRPTGPPGPGGAGANVMPGGVPNPGTSQSGIRMSQTNTMTMGGGQITQNVLPNTGIPQQTLPSSIQPNQLNIQAVGMSSAGGGQQNQINSGGSGMIGQQQQIEMARQQNLLKIHQLQQTLQAAQQQEAQYKSQEIQQTLEHAQAQELQYKQLEQAQQDQRNLNAAVGMQAPQQPNAQRMMRPAMNNSLGLRHLLQQQQQQQPQYRQVLGMQQQMVGPRGQMAPRQMAPGNPQNQQFDEVPNYDFLG
ncbi:hypothetical protein QAD02_019292 [Eretmocerus hayati]|uniref:Uncharacterized protein n=1 Tax=Eretmocerus hayati TaxID=131215 RepID=A0ACC2PIS6_9HYME|nr:hypothetical protein QAD02_019292 [Eretmocerus hayati]